MVLSLLLNPGQRPSPPKNSALHVQGRPLPHTKKTTYRDGLFTGLPVLVSLGIVLMLGVHIPAALNDLLRDAVRFLEVRS